MLRLFPSRRLAVAAVSAAVLALIAGSQLRTAAQTAPENLTPGMLFGPVYVGEGQRVELCSANLGEGELTAMIHFRNLSTGEVTANQTLTLKSGGGECAAYTATGHVVGMARGDGAASDWVSPSNALISTMSVVDINGGTRVSVLGTAKLWLRGL